MKHDHRTTFPGNETLQNSKDKITVEQRNDILGLRALLFAEMRALTPKATKEQVEIAKVKSDLAQTIINSVKVETSYLQAKKASKSGFIPVLSEEE